MTMSRDIGCLDREWRGWVLRGGKLISPAGWEATPQDVLSLPFLRTQLAAYQAEERQRPTKDEQAEPLSAAHRTELVDQ
jgi:Phage protein